MRQSSWLAKIDGPVQVDKTQKLQVQVTYKSLER